MPMLDKISSSWYLISFLPKQRTKGGTDLGSSKRN